MTESNENDRLNQMIQGTNLVIIQGTNGILVQFVVKVVNVSIRQSRCQSAPNQTNFLVCLLNDVVHMFALIIVYLTNSLNWFYMWMNAKAATVNATNVGGHWWKVSGVGNLFACIVHIQVNRLRYVSHPFHTYIGVYIS